MKKVFYTLAALMLAALFNAAPAAALSPLPLPDLTLRVDKVEEVKSYNYGTPTVASYRVWLTITNQGFADVPGVIHFSHREPLQLVNGLLVWPNPTTQMVTATGLKRGASLIRKLTLDAASFQQYYRLTLDLSNNIREWDESNNTVYVNIVPTK